MTLLLVVVMAVVLFLSGVALGQAFAEPVVVEERPIVVPCGSNGAPFKTR